MTHIFKVGDTGLTRGRPKYRVLSLCADNRFPLVVELVDPNTKVVVIYKYKMDGSWAYSERHDFDLLPPAAPKQTFRERFAIKKKYHAQYEAQFDNSALSAEFKLQAIADYLDEQSRKE